MLGILVSKGRPGSSYLTTQMTVRLPPTIGCRALRSVCSFQDREFGAMPSVSDDDVFVGESFENKAFNLERPKQGVEYSEPALPRLQPISTRKHFAFSRSVSMTHRASLPACGRLLHLDSAVRQLRRRFFPLPPMCEVDALPLASTVEWAGGSSF